MLFQTCIHLFRLLDTKEDILKNVGKLTAIDFHSISFHAIEVNGYRQLFGYQNVIFCVQQKKETHTGLERLEGELMRTELTF